MTSLNFAPFRNVAKPWLKLFICCVVDITFVEFNYLIFLTNWLTLLHKREDNGKMIFFFQNTASGMFNKTMASFKGKAVLQLIIYILFLIATSI